LHASSLETKNFKTIAFSPDFFFWIGNFYGPLGMAWAKDFLGTTLPVRIFGLIFGSMATMESIEDYREAFLAHLRAGRSQGEPKTLYGPMHYILDLGGKRLRPILTLMCCELFGGKAQQAMGAAMAIETFHNFSLVHDDIMYRAPLRRGRATVHDKWELNQGLLSWTALLVLD